MTKIILASSSPRRKELLSQAGFVFEVIAPTFDEAEFSLSPSQSSIQQLSLQKAKSISENLTVSALVISADTVVICDDTIMGKPQNREHAYKMLKQLSGKTHRVITGIAVVNTADKKEYTDSAITYVTFNDLSDSDIYNYIDTRKPFDKAGAYGIQELPESFVKKIDGYFDNVVGLPINILIKLIKTINS